MTLRSTSDDLAAVRALLAPANPVPDATLAREDVLAARAGVGLHRAAPPADRPRRAGLAAAGAVAALSVATLVALVAIPAGRGPGSVDLATGPGAKAIRSAYAATATSGTARAMLTVSAEGRTVTADGVGDFDGGSARADITLAGGAGEPATRITVLRTRDATFAKLPDNPLSAGKPWVSVDAATLARLTQQALGDVASPVTGAPLDALAYLKGVSGDVQVVGPDSTRGEATPHYRGSVDPNRVAAQLPAAVRPAAAGKAGQVGQAIPADLWIDGQGRLRKLVLAADLSKVQGAPAGAVTGPATITLELWDFGTPVDVSAPPADQVVEVGGLLGGFLGGSRTP
jgi:hypothetical protein